jgi:CDP-glucose 4,6-dehydratase
MVNTNFWSGRRVFITGHTGFKGGWLATWLHQLGAEIYGYALPPVATQSFYEVAGVGRLLNSTYGDVRDAGNLAKALRHSRADVVFHLAAQPLVRASYRDPVGTYATNVMGSVHLLEAVRTNESVRAVVMVTSDKCYENREWVWGYREDEPMGGYDPYSNSKGCTELVTAAYRRSYFPQERYQEHHVALASARAGNVIGGGDWAEDRLIPDFIRAIVAGEELLVRSPHAIRPWQHVLEPLTGYISLAERLITHGPDFSEGWNFGPNDHDAKPVSWLVQELVDLWGAGACWRLDDKVHPHEAHYLKLDISKARLRLCWEPRWSLAETLSKVVDWYRAHRDGQDMHKISLEQIEAYEQVGV